MALTDADIHRAAGVLIQQSGGQAAPRAEMRAGKLRSAGDLDGEATWHRILDCIEGQQAKAPAGGGEGALDLLIRFERASGASSIGERTQRGRFVASGACGCFGASVRDN